jgi:uncharacterized protein (TIGR00369 family)
VKDLSTGSDTSEQPAGGRSGEEGRPGAPSAAARAHNGPRSLDGVSSFFGMVWEDPQTIRLRIRPELINNGGLLSGVATYALVDYCMGSTLWVQTTAEEHIATISIAINYLQTATEGEIVCTTVLDRRNRTIGIMKSEVRHEDGRLLVTATGSYSIFPARKRPRVAQPPDGAPPAAG